MELARFQKFPDNENINVTIFALNDAVISIMHSLKDLKTQFSTYYLESLHGISMIP